MSARKLAHFPPRIPNSLPHNRAPNSSTHFKSPFLPKLPSVLATNVIKSYFEAGLVEEARTLFDEMPERDVVAWSAMISGYTSRNLHMNAWTTFRELLREGGDVHPNEFTFSSVFKACKSMNSLSCGELVHGLALKHGILGNYYVDNALMDMYATRCADMSRACAVFEEMGVKTPASWTTLISGYTHMGDGHGGLQVFRNMLLVCYYHS